MGGVRGPPLDRAVENCNAAVKQKPDGTNAREARCFVLYRMARYPEAIPDCDAVLKEKLETAGALYVRGLAKQHVGDAAGGARDIAPAPRLHGPTPAFFAPSGVKPQR